MNTILCIANLWSKKMIKYTTYRGKFIGLGTSVPESRRRQELAIEFRIECFVSSASEDDEDCWLTVYTE